MRHLSEKKAGRVKKSTSLLSKILIPMIGIALLQIVSFPVMLVVSGGFSDIKRYSYNMIAEKTENRKNYVETMFNQKTSLVYETAKEINGITDHILEEQEKPASDVRTDKELNKLLLSAYADSLISLIRRDMVNDAFIILDSGALYDTGGRQLRTGLYMRDTDVNENSASDNKDIFMEMGSSEVARSFGLPLDSGWALYLDVTDEETSDYFFRPLKTYADNVGTPLYNLGYWSGPSGIGAQQESVKYTLPLVAEDGTVYGVLGIGILEKTIQQYIPSSDFSDNSTCYVLGIDTDASGKYTPVLYSGAAYSRLVKEDTVIGSQKAAGYNLYDFTAENGVESVGSIQKMNLYNSGSPYRSHNWALISVADKENTLSIYNALVQTVMISVSIALVISIAFAIIISRHVNQPVARMIGELKKSREEKQFVEFNLSGITEIDSLAAEVMDLQEQIAQVKDAEYTAKLLQANAALRDAYDAAKRASHAKTDFLSRMSHDIRTPMNAIIGMTTIARSNLDDRDKISDCLGKISTSSRYLLALINDVLDMSKIEAGKFVLSQENVNILELIDNLLDMVKPIVKEKNHKLSVQVNAIEHENVICDSLRIQQVFMNIMSNAVKYTPSGGHIGFTASEKPSGQSKVGCYEFIFTDDGCGMSPEFLEKVFDPFERETDERVNKEQGTGLGMAITSNIVKMMDGDIRAESEPGKGTKFVVKIFLKLAEAGAVREKELSSAWEKGQGTVQDSIGGRDFSGNRVLLVDDNELNREIATEILGMAGLIVETAENGREAVDKFAASPPDYYQLIFMDIQMPVLNGYQASREIRSLPHADAQSIPIVAMTANAFAEDVQEARDAGMNEHIAKPLDVDKLFGTLGKWL